MKRWITIMITVCTVLWIYTENVYAFTCEPLCFSEFIIHYNIPVIFILELIGLWLKKWQIIKDRYIPVCLVIIGWVIIGIYMLVNESPNLSGGIMVGYFLVNAFMQSVFVTGAAVLGNQLLKQARKKE